LKIKFSTDKSSVIFINENAAEYKAMMLFPAFNKDGPIFWAPAKTHIVYNLLERLKLAFKKIAVDKDVMDFANLPMVLKELPEDFKYHTKPMPFQEIALRFMYTVGGGGLLLDPGMGKSKICCDLIKLMGFKRSLILCPLALTYVWEDEIKTHRPELSIYVFKSTNFEKEWAEAKTYDVVCMNYTKASLLKTHLLKEEFEYIHVDEFLIKDPTSKRTIDITELSRGIPYRSGGSGTLVSNSILDIFSPCRFIEPSIVGTTFSKFLNRHSIRNPNDMRTICNYTKKDEARSILDSVSIVMSKEEWLTLPSKTIHDIFVEPSEYQKTLYSGLSRNYVTKIKDEYLTVDNALVMMSKLSQISNGFCYLSDAVDDNADVSEMLEDEEVKPRKKSPRRTVFFEDQPKIDAMITLIKGDALGKRAIIWYNSNAEFTLITEALTISKYSHVSIRGGTKNIGGIIREFNSNPDIQFLVAQSSTINYGVTVLGMSQDKMDASPKEFLPGVDPSVHTQIFYSINFSYERFLQQLDRCHRLGQTHDCVYYRIFSKTSVEDRVRKALEEKSIVRAEMLIDIAISLRENTQNE
jgi:SNF2 family DNA or RNA helicase